VNDAERGVLRFNGQSGPVAQLVEQGTFNPKVAGSIPARPIISAALLTDWSERRRLRSEG
jgi:hypothetical protein